MSVSAVGAMSRPAPWLDGATSRWRRYKRSLSAAGPEAPAASLQLAPLAAEHGLTRVLQVSGPAWSAALVSTSRARVVQYTDTQWVHTNTQEAHTDTGNTVHRHTVGTHRHTVGTHRHNGCTQAHSGCTQTHSGCTHSLVTQYTVGTHRHTVSAHRHTVGAHRHTGGAHRHW